MALSIEGSLIGANVEVGTADMLNNAVQIPTKLKSIVAAFATYDEDPGAATRIFCDRVINAQGRVTFYDAAVANKSFQYILVGRQ